MKSLSTDLWKV